MSFYIRYFITEDRVVTLPELEAALRQASPGYGIDADIIVLDGEEFGQIDIIERGHPFWDDELAVVGEWAEERRGREALRTALGQARSLVTVQPIWSREDAETRSVLRPLFEWLLAHRAGVLAVEGGTFHDRAGEVV